MTNQLLHHIRKQFPALSGDWTFFDNAGGSQVARQVVERITDYLLNSNVQLGATYEISRLAVERLNEARSAWANMIRSDHPSEIIFGPSTTQLLQNLSKSLVQLFQPGDEVIVTNCDHEANIGPWLNMQQAGIRVKSWKIDPKTLALGLEDLERLITRKTRLLAFTHVSNILGTINPVKEITAYAHSRGVLVCVDGVAFAPHRQVDVADLDTDFYVFSLYKVYGPHISLLYGKQSLLEILPGINHFFIGKEEVPYKLQPGNINYELTYGTLGILDYFNSVTEVIHRSSDKGPEVYYQEMFSRFARHEESLAKPLIDFLSNRSGVRIIGEPIADRDRRVPTISFTVKNRKSSSIPPLVDKHRIGIRWGDFYARRLIDDLGLSAQDGVVRVSLVHYNTPEEVSWLLDILESVI